MKPTTRSKSKINPFFFTLLLSILFPTVTSASGSSWEIKTTVSGSISFDSDSSNPDSINQSTANFYLDGVYLDKFGAGVGYINQTQELNQTDESKNNITLLKGWYSWFPEALPGKISVSFNYYDGTQKITVTQPDTGSGSAGIVTKFEDALQIFNPVISFINYEKTFYIDLGFATSSYQSKDDSIKELTVTQWSPAIGFAFNEQYDWLQLRYYSIDLNNDVRTPGFDKTGAGSLSWTHWVEKETDSGLEYFNVTLLSGERLYTVDHDISRVYNYRDVQKSSVTIGANWKTGEASQLYLYAGQEKFEDKQNDSYDSLFIYAGITTKW